MCLKQHFNNGRIGTLSLCASAAPKICMENWVEKQLRLPLIQNCNSFSLVTFYFANMLTLFTISSFSCKCFNILVSPSKYSSCICHDGIFPSKLSAPYVSSWTVCLPVSVYNNPPRTGWNISFEQFLKIST